MDDSDKNCSYEPIKTWNDLTTYGDPRPGICTINPPCKEKTIQFSFQSHSREKLYDNRINRARKVGDKEYELGSNGSVSESGRIPKVIVCHDFKGGYGDDKFNFGTDNPCNYTFTHWAIVDTFIYFSHNFVTIPPLGWINAAHKHGVKILGTIITEWTDGAGLCSQLLKDFSAIEGAVKQLSRIVNDYGFDGYLVNIENDIENTESLRSFVKLLNIELKNLDKKNEVIWYDSVISTGELKWQDQLNEQNKLFFDACDGIFLNYNWNDEKLQNSVAIAGSDRQFDVYVGVDCFGRGCFGGGGLNTHKAIEKIWTHKLSVAIFAPGWTFECHNNELFQKIDNQLWTKCKEYFGRRAWKLTVEMDRKVLNQDQGMPIQNIKTDLSWSTDFNRGYGERRFCLGKMFESSKPWFNLSEQSYQPITLHHYIPSPEKTDELLKEECEKQLHVAVSEEGSTSEGQGGKDKDKDVPIPIEDLLEPSLLTVEYDTNIGFMGGGSLRIQSTSEHHQDFLPFCCIPVEMELMKPNEYLGICIAYQISDDMDSLKTKPKVTVEIDGMERNIAHDKVQVPVNFFFPTMDLELENQLQFVVSKETPISEVQLNGWNLSCSIYSSNFIDTNCKPHCEDLVLKDIFIGLASDSTSTAGTLNVGYIGLINIKKL